MKKAIALLLCLLMVTSLVACGSNGTAVGDTHTGQAETENNETSTPQESETPTEAVNICAHEWTAYGMTAQPTCSADGTKERICIICGEKETKAVTGTTHAFDDNGTCADCGAKCSVGLKYKYFAEGESWAVVGLGSCTDTDILIPDTHEGLPVVAIADHAFNAMWTEETPITSVIIPDSVTVIGEEAFRSKELTSVVIGAGVEEMGRSAFNGCESLTSLVISDGVKTLGENAFQNCDALTSVTVPASVVNFSDSVFGNCELLTDVYYEGTALRWVEMATNGAFGTTMTPVTIHCSDRDVVSEHRQFTYQSELATDEAGIPTTESVIPALPYGEWHKEEDEAAKQSHHTDTAYAAYVYTAKGIPASEIEKYYEILHSAGFGSYNPDEGSYRGKYHIDNYRYNIRIQLSEDGTECTVSVIRDKYK